ncbi:high mobility group B protein 9-like [Tasmannia lanceolata]|uniref:high mobility group B protein 9-like n=1 Tax=Tasmannia lanceolata TaxID=3420 RepID=UPI0040646FF1
MSEEEKKGPENSPAVVEDKLYPAPVVSHEDVIRNPTLFMDTLKHFHSLLGTRFMIPVIGGKDLDLHLLYWEVTRRGGFEKVVAEKKWKDVISAFKFPPTTTSASFVLRKYYISLLHHYEQVYFFRLQGPLVAPAVAISVRSPSCKPVNNTDLPESTAEPMPTQQEQMPKKRKKEFSGLQMGEPVNFPVMGTIDGKFDHGYLVTVKMGSEILHGILYHPIPSGDSTSLATNNAVIPFNATSVRRYRRKKRGRRRRDPSHPKPNRSAYNFFFAEKHSKLKLLYPEREREFSKMIGESWNKLTQEERMIYQDSGLKDKERYKREMQEYKERLKLVQPIEVIRAGPSSNIEKEGLTKP